MIVKHLPILLVLVPLCGALLSLISFNKKAAQVITTTAVIAAVLLSVYGVVSIESPISYYLGDWPKPIGIEYKLDFLNKPIIAYVNIVLLFVLIFCHDLIDKTVLQTIQGAKQNLFYSILLFVHTGYIGILCTNDLFNLYVFTEIATLSSCILISQSNTPRSLLGAFDYLVLGTIGTTLILIGIGFLFSKTGSLNIVDIQEHLNGMYHSSVVVTGAAFVIIGCLLKVAFFPMHCWMIRAYQGTSGIILTYLAGISGIIGIYIFLRFINFAFDYSQVKSVVEHFLNPIALFTMILCSWFAFKAENFKKIIVYSSAVQIGYAVLLLSTGNNYSIIIQFLVVDSINKVAMFLIVSYLEISVIEANQAKKDAPNRFMRILIAINIVCSSSLPISSMFIMKVNIIELLIKNNLFVSLCVVIITSVISLFYHYRIARLLLFENNTTMYCNNIPYNVTLITLMQFLGYFVIANWVHSI